MAENEAFYGSFIDANGNASPVYARVVDSLYTWMDSTFEVESQRGTGKMEFHKLLKLQALTEPEATLEKYNVPWGEFFMRAAMFKYIWDGFKIPYVWVLEADGFGYGAIDRQAYLSCCVIDVKYDPDSEYAFWNKFVAAQQLIDPATNAPFPSPIPRSAFPAVREEAWAKATEKLVNDFNASVVTSHQIHHIRYDRLLTNSGQVPCQTCLKKINGVRYRCKTCFDWGECEPCHAQKTAKWTKMAKTAIKGIPMVAKLAEKFEHHEDQSQDQGAGDPNAVQQQPTDAQQNHVQASDSGQQQPVDQSSAGDTTGQSYQGGDPSQGQAVDPSQYGQAGVDLSQYAQPTVDPSQYVQQSIADPSQYAMQQPAVDPSQFVQQQQFVQPQVVDYSQMFQQPDYSNQQAYQAPVYTQPTFTMPDYSQQNNYNFGF
ncbi:hypothetical protein DL93DRAFT_2171406 [Clavulina sp. PMI_390]|nr:hypothetical protein DL93DRAFT_2171406 [Clavulina sp. PMI_390]